MNATRTETRAEEGNLSDAEAKKRWADYEMRRNEFYAGFPPCWREFLPAEWLPEKEGDK